MIPRIELDSTTDIDPIQQALRYFDEREFTKGITSRGAFERRLTDIRNGATLPFVVFNCLDFRWEESPGSYPKSRILGDVDTSICVYFQDQLRESVDALQVLGTNDEEGSVDLCIIIPDSELFDSNVFSFSQSEEERTQIAAKVKTDLSGQLELLEKGSETPVMLWSEYCRKYGLLSPDQYTAMNTQRLMEMGLPSANEQEKNIFKGVRKQVEHSRKFFRSSGLRGEYVLYDIPNEEMLNRVIWYCAMYMGEGQALTESGAIVINLEDLRVRKWFNIGSGYKLPIVTPVNPIEYYQWRNSRLK